MTVAAANQRLRIAFGTLPLRDGRWSFVPRGSPGCADAVIGSPLTSIGQ